MLKEVYGAAPLVGYQVSVEDAKTDYEIYKILVSNGLNLTPEQAQRYTDLKAVFEPGT